MFFGRTDVEAETPILWPPDMKSWLIGKDPDAGKDWGQEEKGMTEDEMAGWHHWFDGCEFEWTPGVGDGQWGLACCDSWGLKESDTTEWLNWTELGLGSPRSSCCWIWYLERAHFLIHRWLSSHCKTHMVDRVSCLSWASFIRELNLITLQSHYLPTSLPWGLGF